MNEDFDPAQYKLTEKRNDHLFRTRLVPDLLAGRTPQTRPRAVFLISQPGSGKSRLQREIDPELKRNGGYIDLDTDLYKPYHDEYNALMQRDDKLMTAATRADGRAWMAKAREYALENRINVIVQDIAQDPEHSARMMRDFRKAGYAVEAVEMAVPKVVSDQGIRYRYFEQVRDLGAGRLTVQANADQSYTGVAGVSRLIDEQPGLVDRARLFRRGEGVPRYDNTVESGKWAREPRMAATLAYEREERPWTFEEVSGFMQMQNEMRNPPTPKAAAKLGPDWPATLASLDKQAASKVTEVPPDQPKAAEWMSSYWKHAEQLVQRGELGPETAPTMLALHAHADRVAKVAYEGQDHQLTNHTVHQKVQKAVFMAGQRGADNANLPSSPQEYFSATPERRTHYVEAMRAAKAVQRPQPGVDPPHVRDPRTFFPAPERRNQDSQKGPDLER